MNKTEHMFGIDQEVFMYYKTDSDTVKKIYRGKVTKIHLDGRKVMYDVELDTLDFGLGNVYEYELYSDAHELVAKIEKEKIEEVQRDMVFLLEHIVYEPKD